MSLLWWVTFHNLVFKKFPKQNLKKAYCAFKLRAGFSWLPYLSCMWGSHHKNIHMSFPQKGTHEPTNSYLWVYNLSLGFPNGSDSQESACNAEDPDWIPGLGRSPGGEHGNPLQYSCLENPMDRGAWWATVHGVAKSQKGLKQLSMHAPVSYFCNKTLQN